MRLIYIFENANKETLYHGTLLKNVKSIKTHGLKPTVGKFTKGIYGKKAKPLVFAAPKSRARAVYCSLVSNIAHMIGHAPSENEIEQHGAIAVIEADAGKFQQHTKNRRKGSLEPSDHYSIECVKVDKFLTGKELVQWLKDNGVTD